MTEASDLQVRGGLCATHNSECVFFKVSGVKGCLNDANFNQKHISKEGKRQQSEVYSTISIIHFRHYSGLLGFGTRCVVFH